MTSDTNSLRLIKDSDDDICVVALGVSFARADRSCSRIRRNLSLIESISCAFVVSCRWKHKVSPATLSLVALKKDGTHEILEVGLGYVLDVSTWKVLFRESSRLRRNICRLQPAEKLDDVF